MILRGEGGPTMLKQGYGRFKGGDSVWRVGGGGEEMGDGGARGLFSAF